MVASVIGIMSTAVRANDVLVLGKEPPPVQLSGESGSKVTGGDWSSDSMRGRLTIFFYVDPDESELNNELADAIAAQKFDQSRVTSVALVNMAATWLPNVVLNAKLKSKQERFPRTLYVKDFKKVLVQKWGLADDNSDVLLFDKSGKLLFSYAGKVDKSKIEEFLKLVRENQ